MPNFYPGDSGPVIIPRPPPPLKAHPGPPARGSYSGTRTTAVGHPSPPSKPPPDIFGSYVGPAVDAAKQMVQQFLALVGYQSGLDANMLTLQLLQSNLLGDQQAAMQYLYGSGAGMTQDIRDSHPNAAFGLDALTFATRKDAMDAMFEALIAQDPTQIQAGGDSLHSLYYQAFKNNWSQSQVLQRLQNDPAFADLRSTQPWLAAGQTEQQAAQQFASLYGTAPVGTQALAGWFQFNTGTAQLSRTSREGIVSAAPQPSTSEAR